MPKTQELRVTMLDLPEANMVAENIQHHPCVQRIVKIPPDTDEIDPRVKFQKMWEWIVKNKKPTFKGSSDKSMERVDIFLKVINGRSQIHVRTGKGRFSRFELMDYESDQERLTAKERNIVRRRK